MTERKGIRTPIKGEIPHTAGEYLYKHGPCIESELFLAVEFGRGQHERAVALQSAIRSGWLMETSRGTIACSPAATDYYDEQSDKEPGEYVGQIVPAATRNVFATQGLGKKYQINSRGLRPASDLAPAWSVREGITFHTKA
jgi:hypothetical protein